MMILIDTNIIISSHYPKANRLLKDALKMKYNGCVAHQNLLEFFSVITNPKRIEKPLEFSKAVSLIEAYLKSTKIRKIFPGKETLLKTIQLSKEHSLTKAEIFDCYLVATMLENGVFEIYTENTLHFEKYSGLKASNPFQ